MKPSRVIALALSIGAFVGAANGQGLLSIGSNFDDFDQEDIPLTWTVSSTLGWDSNINSTGDTGIIEEEDSFYVQGGIGTMWRGGSRITKYTLGASASVLYYFDEVSVDDDENWFYSARLQGSVAHRPSRRLLLSDSFYVTYEFEPDQSVGASTSTRTDQYFYAHNSFSVSYAWTRLFSTVATYTVSGIFYEDEDVEDRVTNVLGLQARYMLSRTTTLVGEYRFAVTDYEEGYADYHAHYLLAGFDHMFDRNTRATLRVGAEFRDYDETGSESFPYLEGSVIRELSEDFSVRWVVRYGLEDSELGIFERRESLRTAISATYDFDTRLRGTGSLTYVHSSFEDAVIAGADDEDEDFFGLSLSLSYLLYSNVRLNGGYTFSTLSSDTPLRDHDRHRVFVGVSATF